MDSKKEEWLLDRYWKGETTPEEEQSLREHAISDQKGKTSEDVQQYFSMLNDLSGQKLGGDFDVELFNKIRNDQKPSFWITMRQHSLKIAASALIIITAGILYFYANRPAEPVALKEDPRRAFELTKQALLLVSAKLHKGASYTSEALGKFDEVQEKVKNKNKNI